MVSLEPASSTETIILYARPIGRASSCLTAKGGGLPSFNYAVYGDAQYDPFDNLILQLAVRHEDFDDFGTTTNMKAGVNAHLTDQVGVRSTFSTGFKAPTPGQANASNTTTETIAGKLVNNGTIPSTNPLAVSKGGKPLKPEKSRNFSIGTFVTLDNLDITLDYFDITVKDRLNLSSEITLTEDEVEQLIAQGVPGANDINKFRFFINDFDTRTRGVDFVATLTTESWGETDWTLAANWTNTEITEYSEETVNEDRIRQIEDTTPDTRINLTANHRFSDFRVLGRVSYYGQWWDAEAAETLSGQSLFDLESEWRFTDNQLVLAGISNVFDEKGDELATAKVVGNRYSQYTPFGFSGRFIYAKYQYQW